MQKQKFPKNLGLRHIALRVNFLKDCANFYKNVIGMMIELETEEYVYLTSGKDNISLHQNGKVDFEPTQRLEHFGFAVNSPEDVDNWYQHCKQHNANILNEPKTFGIGTRAFSVIDPSGNEVEFTYHPPMVAQKNL